MVSSLSISAASLLCLLSMAVFAATARLHVRYLLALAAGLGAGSLLALAGRPVGPAEIGCIVIAVVSVHLWTRLGALALPLGVGILAVHWPMLLVVQGAPAPFAVAAVIAATLTLLWIAQRNPQLTSATLQTEATLLVLVMALLVASAPTVAAGWRSAAALNGSTTTAPASAAPQAEGLSLLAICLAPMLLGALYSMWRRSR
jgi:hypothetical protein